MKLLKVTLVLMAALSASTTRSETIEIDPTVQATYCGSIDFCGIPGLGPALGTQLFAQRGAAEYRITGVQSVQSALLNLTPTTLFGTNEAFTLHYAVIEIHGYKGNGTTEKEDVDVLNLLATSPPIDTLAVYSFDVTSFVRELAQAGADYAGFAVRDVVVGSGANFYTSNVLDVLGVSIDPEPSVMPGAACRCRSSGTTFRGHH